MYCNQKKLQRSTEITIFDAENILGLGMLVSGVLVRVRVLKVSLRTANFLKNNPCNNEVTSILHLLNIFLLS